ncbi:MAG: hypothetical protein IVW57_16570 [Ktedonobacterales bacterium]|nr:hypothetical protein [Ktedonobacterales bacterium]
MREYSYEGILRAVGRVLDEAEAKGFAIRDEENGLLVQTFDERGEPQHTLTFGLGDLVELLDRDEAPRYERRYTHDEGTLLQFLGRRELVGAGR